MGEGEVGSTSTLAASSLTTAVPAGDETTSVVGEEVEESSSSVEGTSMSEPESELEFELSTSVKEVGTTTEGELAVVVGAT